MKTARLPCGCRYEHDHGERERWVDLCPPHKTESDALHARAQVDHRASLADFYRAPAQVNP